MNTIDQITLQLLSDALDRIAPPTLAGDWDNTGLLLGDPSWPLTNRPVLLTIDLTDAVLEEALTLNAGAVIAYHPPFFSKIKRFTADTREGRTIARLARIGCGVYSPHTALDAIADGVADWLLTACAPANTTLNNRAPLEPAHSGGGSGGYKLVVFTPDTAADAITEALHDAGAARIGDYSHCAFRAPGLGTFLPGESANPAVGSRGTLERVDEVRLEAVCPKSALPRAIAAIRAAHPYEEPPIDLLALEPHPSATLGPGRIATLSAPMTAQDIATTLAPRLSITDLKLAGDPNQQHTRIAVCPGSGASLFTAARAQGATLFITGEATHHDALSALTAGLSLILAGHTNTERNYLPTYRDTIAKALPTLDLRISAADRAPFTPVRL